MRRTWAAAAALAGGLLAAGPAWGQVILGDHFLGTNGLQDLQVRVAGSPALWLLPTASAPNLVCGSAINEVTAGRVGATIGGGGGRETDGHRVVGDYGSVGGGLSNVAGGEVPTDNFPDATVRGGLGNAAIDEAATIGGGAGNLATGTGSTIAGGEQNSAFGEGSTIGGGLRNTALAAYSTVPGGADARASRYGQMAFSAGGFVSFGGDAQASLFVVRRVTSNASPTELRLDGDLEALSVDLGRALAFRALVSARSAAGESAGYLVAGVIANVGGTTAFVDPPSFTLLGEDDADWDLQVVADDAADVLSLRAVGGASATVRWVGTVETAEVGL